MLQDLLQDRNPLYRCSRRSRAEDRGAKGRCCTRSTYRPTMYLSWKVRYRTFPWFFSQMSKLYRARSLYRRQILQVNIRWKAPDEIYKIYMLLHRSDLNISKQIRQTSSHFLVKFCKIRYLNLFWILFIDFCSDFDEILSEFRRYFTKVEIFRNFWIF